jgi:hypothetical protein
MSVLYRQFIWDFELCSSDTCSVVNCDKQQSKDEAIAFSTLPNPLSLVGEVEVVAKLHHIQF